MAQVRHEVPADKHLSSVHGKFRLGVFDLLLPALIALLLSSLFALLLWGYFLLDPLTIPRLRLELLAFLQALLYNTWYLPALISAGAACLVLAAALAADLLAPWRSEWQAVGSD